MKQFGFLILLILFAFPVFAQSTNESFPTPVNAAEVSGTIAARDIGDSRLTRHFYTFFAENGDLNLNIETANFDGDIDLFEAGTFRPIAKITVAAGGDASKTSRIVYFRQRERVVLRIEGRTLVDEAARYKINFSGSFAAATGLPAPPDDLTPKVERKPGEDVVARVNSAGAIVEVLPSKKPAPKPVEEKKEVETPRPEPPARTARTPRTRRTPPANRRTNPPPQTESTPDISSETTAAEPKPTPAPRRTRQPRQPRTPRQPAARRTTETPSTPQPDPLASVRLTIQLKNGEQIERPMSDIFRVSVDKGQLTVITKNGKIERYNLLEVAKFSIEQ
jgi:hypothetical protein